MISKKKKRIVFTLIAVILMMILLNSNIVNKPKIILYIHGDKSKITGMQYEEIIEKVDGIFKGDTGRTKSEFDKQEEERCKNFRSIEIIYPYPKLRLVKVEDRMFNLTVDFSSKILVPLDKNNSCYELFTCYSEYTSGGLGFDRIDFTECIYSIDKKTFD